MQLQINRYHSASEYLQDSQSYLEQEEALNSLLLGLAMSHRDKKNDSSLYLSIRDNDGIIFTAMQTEGRNLIIYGDQRNIERSASLLVDYTNKEEINIPGLTGSKELVLALGQYFNRVNHWKYSVEYKELVYKLTEVQVTPSVKGQLKIASIDQLGNLSKWMELFYQEALNQNKGWQSVEITKDKILKEEIFTWQTQSAVTMSCIARPTPNGITINYVYTPLEHRGNGFATKLVAELTKLMLQKGYEFCTLFTDMDNPTSNRIYSKIGYKVIGEFRTIKFAK